MKKITLIGNGRMGEFVKQCISESNDMTLYSCVDKNDEIKGDCDCIVDFSSPSSIDKIVEYCKKNSTPAVIATTGHNENQLNKIKGLGKYVAVFFSQNTSMGIAALNEAAKKISLCLKDCDIDIIEKHHKNKADSPSGTALFLKNSLNRDINISSIRAGDIVGEHEIIFTKEGECVSIKHIAFTRKIFTIGALNAVNFILNKPSGIYNIMDMLL